VQDLHRDTQQFRDQLELYRDRFQDLIQVEHNPLAPNNVDFISGFLAGTALQDYFAQEQGSDADNNVDDEEERLPPPAYRPDIEIAAPTAEASTPTQATPSEAPASAPTQSATSEAPASEPTQATTEASQPATRSRRRLPECLDQGIERPQQRRRLAHQTNIEIIAISQYPMLNPADFQQPPQPNNRTFQLNFRFTYYEDAAIEITDYIHLFQTHGATQITASTIINCYSSDIWTIWLHLKSTFALDSQLKQQT
jgi:hypothetical protein